MVHGLNLRRANELNLKLCRAKKFESSEQIDKRRYFSAKFRPNPKNHSSIFVALKNKWYFVVDYLLSLGDHFGAVNFSGKFAGFTALHHACFEEETSLVSKLLEKYKVDPSVQACDGVVPVQLAAFLGRFDIVKILLDFGVSIDTELSFSLFKKYGVKTLKWNSGFSDKMTLFYYLTFNHHYGLQFTHPTVMFLLYKPTLTILDDNNRTLLMHAIDNEQWILLMTLVGRSSKQEINQLDDFGYTAVHVILAKMLENKSQKNEDRSEVNEDLSCWLQILINSKADVDVMVNGDPTTLPIHIAAYNGLWIPTMFLLMEQKLFFSSLPRPLYYVTKGLNEFRVQENQDENSHRLLIMTQKEIIEDIYLKRFLKYPVHPEEVKLMEQLIGEEDEVKESVKKLDDKYKNINSDLKKSEVLFGDRTMSLYDVLMAPQKEYFTVVKDHGAKFIVDVLYFRHLTKLTNLARSRLERCQERIQILVKWQEIAVAMIKSLLLPYDCVLHIVEYMTNEELENLIEAFSGISS